MAAARVRAASGRRQAGAVAGDRRHLDGELGGGGRIRFRGLFSRGREQLLELESEPDQDAGFHDQDDRVEDDAAAASRTLAEAQQIAERGPMPLFLADVHLHRARLFRDKAELAKARALIEKYSAPGAVDAAFMDLQRFWDGLLSRFQVECPDKDAQRMAGVEDAHGHRLHRAAHRHKAAVTALVHVARRGVRALVAGTQGGLAGELRLGRFRRNEREDRFKQRKVDHLPLIHYAIKRPEHLGGGFEAALSSQVLIAERSARFGFPEIMFNLFPGMGAYSLISRRIGGKRALHAA